MRSSSLFMIALLGCLSVCFLACHKKNDAPAIGGYVAHMGGARNWHGHYEEQIFSTGHDSSYNTPDSHEEIKLLNDTLVYAYNEYFSYRNSDTDMGGVYYFGVSGKTLDVRHIAYYYTRDSLSYIKRDGSMYQSTYLTFNTYK